MMAKRIARSRRSVGISVMFCVLNLMTDKQGRTTGVPKRGPLKNLQG
jgi:hypothetical protein